MIHQFIFAHPKPGMSEADFQDYWLNVHAVQYASKIPQIRRYQIDTRVPFGPEPADPLFSGVAEIWLANEEEQLASLQTKEFLEGARLDEPRWAAFWRTVGLDTTTHVLKEGPPLARESQMLKVFTLVKRKAGSELEDFRRYGLEEHAAKVLAIPGIQRYYQCYARDGLYTLGESLLDGISLMWFENSEALAAAALSPEWQQAQDDLKTFVEPRYIQRFVTTEHWIIGPESR